MNTNTNSIWNGTYRIPWDDPDFSRRMLAEHLSQDHDLASRRSEWIDKQVAWIHEHLLGATPSRILDLGCGPGFYSHRLATLGHDCRGIDFGPASIVLVVGGIVIMAVRGQLAGVGGVSLSLPPVTMVDPREIWPVLRDAGLAQVPLTATNAVIATSVLITEYWPNRRLTNRQLAVNMGVMNIVLPFFGGMPLCHGAGGLAGQHCFGARTGGTNIIEGTIEIALGILLAGSIAAVFAAFPRAIVGAMMLLVGVEMVKFAHDLDFNRHLVPVAATLAGSLLANMAVGFAAGLAVHYLLVGKEHRDANAQQ